MDARYAEPLDLAAMAAAAGFSRYHFAREFRAAFGETPVMAWSRPVPAIADKQPASDGS